MFLVLTGGIAYAANAVFSEDIVDGGVRSADVYSLSGRGIDGTVCVTAAGLPEPRFAVFSLRLALPRIRRVLRGRCRG